MEGLLVLVGLFIIFGPITISIIALAKAASARDELAAVRRRLLRLETEAKSAPPFEAPARKALIPAREPEVAKPSMPEPEPAPPPRVEPPPPPLPKPAPPPVIEQTVPPRKPSMGLEFLMGGRATAFIGVTILVIGIALLVGYAIQNSWLGEGARVLLGLASGLGLVGLGHWVGRLDEKYEIFSRVLIGGGSALFYFTVFAAYAYYEIIGAVMAGIGLFLCAAGVFGLALFYRSRSVAILGVLGAFVTPLLIGGEMDAGIFPLVYVALINVPVIALGVRRDWQSLYNLAFAFTVVHSLLWMSRLDAGDFAPGLVFFIVLYGQFAFLGLLKLRGEQRVLGRTTDLLRLILLSLFLPGMVYWLFEESGRAAWTGLAFALLGLMQFGVAALAYKTVARFSGEITAFVAGGVFALAMAFPVQFDGEWVSLGWGIEGAILAWFATRVRSTLSRMGAFLLGLIGIFKVLAYDIDAYMEPPNLILNARFAVGLISAALLWFQGKMLERYPEEEGTERWRDIFWWGGALAFTALSLSDVFWTLGSENLLSWQLSSLYLLAWGAVLVFLAPRNSTVVWLGRGLLLIAPVKILLIDIAKYGEPPNLFWNARFAMGLLAAGLLALQGKYARGRGEEEWRECAWWVAALTVTVLSLTDVFWTLGFDTHASWLLSSLLLMACGAAFALFAPRKSNVVWLGRVLLLVLPAKLLLVDTLMAGGQIGAAGGPFANRIIWFQLAMLAALLLIQPRLKPRSDDERESVERAALWLNLLPLISGLALLSLEIGRARTDWADMAITILWAVCALALILFGMKRRTAPHRYFGLVLVGLATLKVLIVDSSELGGLQRIFAFIGTGVLLLLLAFAYQKASAFFESLADGEQNLF